jgi:hypothetical protein
LDDPAEPRVSDHVPPLAELIDGAARKIMTGITIAGALVALAIYSRPETPQFETDVIGTTVLRTDLRSGRVLACEGQRCYVVVERGQRLHEGPLQKALPAPASPTGR